MAEMTEPATGAGKAPILDVRGLRKSFGALVATDDVSLDLQPGEIHALIGPNGAGKSTLIKLIAGELTPDAGDIRFEGRSLLDEPAARRPLAGLGRSFQVSALAGELTVLQHVVLAEIGRSRTAFRFFRRASADRALTDAARRHLERVDIADLADRPAATLAHGQRRLLEVAIALALRPKAFLLDEPMAGLGEGGSKELTRVLDRLRREAPILLIEHDMDAVFALADRVSVLVYGQVIASGTVDEIRRDPAVQEAYLGEMA